MTADDMMKDVTTKLEEAMDSVTETASSVAGALGGLVGMSDADTSEEDAEMADESAEDTEMADDEMADDEDADVEDADEETASA